MFPPATYTERRQKLHAQLDTGLILLPGNVESPMNYRANVLPWRQDSSFLYFFGLDLPGLAGVVDLDEGKDVVFGDDVTMDDIIWMGPQPPQAELAAHAGVTDTQARAALADIVAKAKAAGRTIHYLPPYRGETVVLLQELLGMTAAEVMAGASLPLIRAVVEQRETKSDEEVEQIELALDISRAMHTCAMGMAEPGMVEQEVVGAVDGIVRACGSMNSFPTIFTIHGETLHNHHHDNVMQAGDIVIHDSGAESPLHYASDITRTFPVGGKFDARQRDVYSLVLKAQLTAIDAIAPEVPYRDVHLLAAETLATGLCDLGLMKGDPKEAVAKGAHALFFQTGLGHMLGLDVHDMEGYGEDHVGYDASVERSKLFGTRNLRLARPLQPGFTLTVEPGLYFIPALIDKWTGEQRHAEFIDYAVVETFRDFGGVRIEDDVLVTAEGRRVLGKPIPKAVDEVEALCS